MSETTQSPSATPAETTVAETNPQHAMVQQRLSELEAMLLSRDPAMKNHLLEIHKALIQYEELVHLLTDEEISILMAAQQIHTDTVIVADAVKASKAANKKAAAKITLDML